MRCRGVDGEEVGVKCCCMQGCCECARLGMRSWWRMMQVVVSTNTRRFSSTARQSQVCLSAPIMIEGGSPTQRSSTGSDVVPRLVGEGMGRVNDTHKQEHIYSRQFSSIHSHLFLRSLGSTGL